MASDPVAEALHAASRAVFDLLCQGPANEADLRAATATAIAAFLRALPVSGMRGHSAWEGEVTSSDPARNSGIWHARELAAAVERAAREGRDG